MENIPLRSSLLDVVLHDFTITGAKNPVRFIEVFVKIEFC